MVTAIKLNFKTYLAIVIINTLVLCKAAPIQESYGLVNYSGGCYYNYNHYNDGDQILTNEPCLNCTCHKSMLMCYLKVCPFTKPIGQDCTIEKKTDQCCPVIICPEVPVKLLEHETTVLTTPSTGIEIFGCKIGDHVYAEGAQVPSDPVKPCELCYCIRNSTSCIMQECTLHLDACTPIYDQGICCPVRYICDRKSDVRSELDHISTTNQPSPGYLLPTTDYPDKSSDCFYNDKHFPDGFLVPSDNACEHCYCMRGEIICAMEECGTLLQNEGRNCTSAQSNLDQCCPSKYICEDYFDISTTTANEISSSTLYDITENPILHTIQQLKDKISEDELLLQEHINIISNDYTKLNIDENFGTSEKMSTTEVIMDDVNIISTDFTKGSFDSSFEPNEMLPSGEMVLNNIDNLTNDSKVIESPDEYNTSPPSSSYIDTTPHQINYIITDFLNLSLHDNNSDFFTTLDFTPETGTDLNASTSKNNKIDQHLTESWNNSLLERNSYAPDNVQTQTAGNTDDNKLNVTIPYIIPGEGDCLVNNSTYLNNSAIPMENICKHNCVCFNSIVKCEIFDCYMLLFPENLVENSITLTTSNAINLEMENYKKKIDKINFIGTEDTFLENDLQYNPESDQLNSKNKNYFIEKQNQNTERNLFSETKNYITTDDILNSIDSTRQTYDIFKLSEVSTKATKPLEILLTGPTTDIHSLNNGVPNDVKHESDDQIWNFVVLPGMEVINEPFSEENVTKFNFYEEDNELSTKPTTETDYIDFESTPTKNTTEDLYTDKLFLLSKQNNRYSPGIPNSSNKLMKPNERQNHTLESSFNDDLLPPTEKIIVEGGNLSQNGNEISTYTSALLPTTTMSTKNNDVATPEKISSLQSNSESDFLSTQDPLFLQNYVNYRTTTVNPSDSLMIEFSMPFTKNPSYVVENEFDSTTIQNPSSYQNTENETLPSLVSPSLIINETTHIEVTESPTSTKNPDYSFHEKESNKYERYQPSTENQNSFTEEEHTTLRNIMDMNELELNVDTTTIKSPPILLKNELEEIYTAFHTYQQSLLEEQANDNIIDSTTKMVSNEEITTRDAHHMQLEDITQALYSESDATSTSSNFNMENDSFNVATNNILDQTNIISDMDVSTKLSITNIMPTNSAINHKILSGSDITTEFNIIDTSMFNNIETTLPWNTSEIKTLSADNIDSTTAAVPDATNIYHSNNETIIGVTESTMQNLTQQGFDYMAVHNNTQSSVQSNNSNSNGNTDMNIGNTYLPSYFEEDYIEEEESSAFGPGTCRYGGKLFVSAQQIPREDPCDFCFCFRGDIICLQQSCPPPIPGCHEEPIQGFCCPRYECSVANNTMGETNASTLSSHFAHSSNKIAFDKIGCNIQGQLFKVGEVISSSSGPCMHCECGGNGQMKCEPKICTPEPMLRQMIAVVASRRK